MQENVGKCRKIQENLGKFRKIQENLETCLKNLEKRRKINMYESVK